MSRISQLNLKVEQIAVATDSQTFNIIAQERSSGTFEEVACGAKQPIRPASFRFLQSVKRVSIAKTKEPLGNLGLWLVDATQGCSHASEFQDGSSRKPT
ncbi:MAG: hypothetical protein CL912_20685 [Deltaproteobacteria bacterium]|nr:hypothetical protein [Deltaproteobacteria bacterium]